MKAKPKEVQTWLAALRLEQHELYLPDHGPEIARRNAEESVAGLRRFVGLWVRLVKSHYAAAVPRRQALDLAWESLFKFMRDHEGQTIVFPTKEELDAIEAERREQ